MLKVFEFYIYFYFVFYQGSGQEFFSSVSKTYQILFIMT